jgi:MYXO-CTERM domain-containing protein
MARTTFRIGLLAALGPLLASCQGTTPEEEIASEVQQAVNVCNATVAANLIVDGIPAYAQCTASTNSAIYSNNGVDTATSAASSDWKQTQRNGGYQCTELLHRYWLFKWNITWLPNGNAGTWCDTTPSSSSGIVQTTTPVHGDAIIFAPGVCGADSSTGHVALIDTVDTAGSKVTYVEQNGSGRRTSAWTCATCFLHVVANNGAGGSSGTGGATSTTGGATATGGTTATGGAAFGTAGRSNTGGRSSTAIGGSAATTGGTATYTGGRAASGGAVTSATGGKTSAPSGGSLATGGSSPSNTGGKSSIGSSAPTGGAVNGSGGASSSSTGGAANGNSTSSAAGGTATTGTPATTSGGDAVGVSFTTTAAGQGVVSNNGVVDQNAGCTCSVPGKRTSGRALGWMGLAIAAVSLRARRRQTKRSAAP